VAVALELLVLTLLVSGLHVHYLIGSIVATGAYLLANFALNRAWAFRRAAAGAPVRGQLARHVFVALVGSAGIALLLWLFVGKLGLPYLLGWLLAGALAFVAWTYPMSRAFSFRERPAEPLSLAAD
jgi:putative flippase GtrA